MKGTLRLQDNGWVLEANDGTHVDSGEYPLEENQQFIEDATESLAEHLLPAGATLPERSSMKNIAKLTAGNKPYTKVDDRTEQF